MKSQAEVKRLVEQTRVRLKQGYAPPREIYLAPHREQIDWSQLPEWARPIDPEVFEGCCHEG